MNHSTDIDRLLEAANNALDGSNSSEFLRIGIDCIAASVPPTQLAQLAIKARQHGFAECGQILLKHYIRNTSTPNEAIYSELAFQKRLAGDHQAAAKFFSIAATLPGARFSTGLNYIHMLFATGAADSAQTNLALLVPKTPIESNLHSIMSEFGNYLQHFPLSIAEEKLISVNSDGRCLSSDQVAYKITQAVETCTPFSLIRLGDGEGAFIRLGTADESQYPTLYDANRHNRMSMWFGPEFEWRKNGFFEVTLNLMSSIRNSDIVAIPDIAWLRNAYSISSQTGVPSLVNIVRLLSDTTVIPNTLLLTKASIAKELHIRGYYERLLRSVRRATVISCLPDLPDLLRGYFGLDEVNLIKIPGEQGSRHALGEHVEFGDHYPNSYKHVQISLQRPWAGELVLIAGGILGKLYAATIKQYGGVAIDIGSLADRWLGKKTRPGEDPRLKLEF